MQESGLLDGDKELAKRLCGTYSGGNKRKLSLGCGFIGSTEKTKVVFLDEPTTGLDPVSRRKVWGFVEKEKTEKKKAVLLITHAMEEADALSTRISIMVNGQIEASGTPQELKARHGSGYTLEVRMKGTLSEGRILEFLVEQLRGVGEVEVLRCTPYAEGELVTMNVKSQGNGTFLVAAIFEAMEGRGDEEKKKLGVVDYSLTQTTMDDVFLRFAEKQERELLGKTE